MSGGHFAHLGGVEARLTVVAAGDGGQPCGVFPRGCGGGDGGAGIAPEHGFGAGVEWVKPTMRAGVISGWWAELLTLRTASGSSST